MSFINDSWQVGNLPTGIIGCWENDQELKVRDMVDEFRFGTYPASLIEDEMRERGIEYWQLPQYIKDMVDEIDVY